MSVTFVGDVLLTSPDGDMARAQYQELPSLLVSPVKVYKGCVAVSRVQASDEEEQQPSSCGARALQTTKHPFSSSYSLATQNNKQDCDSTPAVTTCLAACDFLYRNETDLIACDI